MSPVDITELLPIAQMAAAVGLGSARIRNWEKRWGWPVSVRDTHGRLCYPSSLIPHLREAARRSDCGRSLRDDIIDGVPVWLAGQPRPRPPVYDLTRCLQAPFPRTTEGQRLRAALLQALAEQNEAGVVAVLARLPTIHPADRETAVIAVLRAISHPLAAGFAPPVPHSDAFTHIPDTELPMTTAPDLCNPTDASDTPMTDLTGVVPSAHPPPVSPGQIMGDDPPVTPVDVTAAVASEPPAPEVAPGTIETGPQIPAAQAPQAVEPSAALESLSPPAPVRHRKQQVSDDTWADWQATLARQATARRREQEAIAARKARAEAFRHLRQALKRLDAPGADPTVQNLASDQLAVQVHEAPEHIREILAALLSSLSTRRPRRQAR